MKRFLLIASMTVVLLAVSGIKTFAVWDITFESKTVGPNQTGVTVDVFASWDANMQALAIPVVVREIDPGSFWTGTLPYDTGWAPAVGVAWNWSNPGWATLIESLIPRVPSGPCNTNGDVGYDGVTPDHFMIVAQSVMGQTTPPEQARHIVTLTFDVTGNLGSFEFDTACFATPLTGIYMIDDNIPYVDHGPMGIGDATFHRGIITIDRAVCMDSTSVLPGHNASIRLNMTNMPEIGGFDLLVCYDRSGLNFLSAKPLGEVAEWEYFTYRYSSRDNCGGGCPSGYIRMIGIADMPNGETPDPSIFQPEGSIAELTFSTTSDLSFIGQCFHLNYCWLDCGDNVISSKDGNEAYMAKDIEEILPDEDCLAGEKGYTPSPAITFCHGIICIVPPDDARGDINLNGVANEVADAVLFANYFIYGPLVLHDLAPPDYYENRRLASDINDDGVPLTVADLVYLIRIITGDASPYPESGEGGKMTPLTNGVNVSCIIDDGMVVRSQSQVDVGAAAFVFRHNGADLGMPVLSDKASRMTIRFSNRDGELRVLVYSMKNNSIDAGAYELFTIPTTGKGTIDLVEVQFSDARGNMLAVNTAKVTPPKTYALLQNYPNPFNAGTIIRFALPETSDWSLRVYNIAGQLIEEFKGHSTAGLVNVHWDATDAASGVYLYKLIAGDFTDTKKMTLMK